MKVEFTQEERLAIGRLWASIPDDLPALHDTEDDLNIGILVRRMVEVEREEGLFHEEY